MFIILFIYESSLVLLFVDFIFLFCQSFTFILVFWYIKLSLFITHLISLLFLLQSCLYLLCKHDIWSKFESSHNFHGSNYQPSIVQFVQFAFHQTIIFQFLTIDSLLLDRANFWTTGSADVILYFVWLDHREDVQRGRKVVSGSSSIFLGFSPFCFLFVCICNSDLQQQLSR